MAQKTERPQNSGGGFADMGDGGCKAAVQVSNSNMETARKHISSIKKKMFGLVLGATPDVFRLTPGSSLKDYS